MLRSLAIATVGLTLGACTQSAAPSPELGNGAAAANDQALIYDQTHNAGSPGFFFLPPLAPQPVTHGVFEARLEPKVRIDRVDAAGHTQHTLVTFTAHARVDGEMLRRLPSRGLYIVRFRTDRYNLSPSATYRIRVLVGDRELGFADIDVVTSAREFRQVNQNAFVPLRKGTTLPIAFRIEKHAVDRDGDGVFDWLDNCPTVSNPPISTSGEVLPQGGTPPYGCDYEADECDPAEGECNGATFAQLDSDHDGIGDACECAAGYTGGGLSSCVDIDECASATPACDALTSCTNTQGGFLCGSCPTGYSGSGTAGCVDVDECALGTDDCSALSTCGNVGGGFVCSPCPTGYAGDGHVCADIDECATAHGGCDPMVACINTQGSRSCGDCPTGYVGGGQSGCTDVDECAGPTPACDALTTCTNTAGGFACGDCPPGYRGDGIAGCVDVDECAEQLDTCSALVTCGNTAGSYQCGACPTGYAGDGHVCSDVDECATDHGGCSLLAACNNTEGSHACGACPPGYVGDGFVCTDIDECAAATPACDALTTCTNEPGGYRCGECPSGYAGSGVGGCLDVDECAQGLHTCSPLVGCANSAGSYQCGDCPAGYVGDGHVCADVDECLAEADGCDPLVSCTNTVGSYECGACPTGYAGGGLSGCTDIDECAGPQAPCDALTTCTNAAGTFGCSACPAGYSGDGYAGCLDIDECAAGTDDCSELVTCENAPGGFACSACPPGYAGDGRTCADIDECLDDDGGCDPLTICTNLPGSWSCSPCPAGHTGDGSEGCVPITDIACFTPELLTTFSSDDATQFASGLTGSNLDTPPGVWRTSSCDLDPPQGSYLNGRYCPMFEQVIDHRDLHNMRIELSFFSGHGPQSHPGILFRGTAGRYGWLYIRPHQNGTNTAIVLSSGVDGFIGYQAGGPHVERVTGVVSDVGFGRQVDLVLEIVDDKLSLDVNGVRRIDQLDIAGLGYPTSGQAGVATCDNTDPSMVFTHFAVTALP